MRLPLNEEHRRLGKIKAALKLLLQNPQAWMTRRELFGSGEDHFYQTRLKIFAAYGLLHVEDTNPKRKKYKVADAAGIKELLGSDELLVSTMRADREGKPLLKMPPPTPPPSMSPELGRPPSIENIQRPPAGAPDSVVQDWIFTLLHAQTENLIYVREQVDKILAAMKEQTSDTDDYPADAGLLKK